MPLTKVQAEMGQSNAPAFSYYQSVAQSVSNNTLTKITFTTSEWDTTGGMYSSSRFTPTVAGYYQVNASVGYPAGVTTGYTYTVLYKNGSFYRQGVISSASGLYVVPVHTLVYLNGTTDYVEVYSQQNSGSSRDTSTGTAVTFFNAALVRTA